MGPAVRHEDSAADTNRHILLAEDDLNTRLVLSSAIRTAGYKVTSAENGREASFQIREIVSSHRDLDLLVLDIYMPGLNGVQLIDLLNSTHIRLPIIVITGYANTDLTDKLMRRGCLRVLHKPFKPSDLLSAIGDVLTGPSEGHQAETAASSE